MNREKRYAKERRKVTKEATQKTAELAAERVDTRDFALEAVRRAMAERDCRADESSVVLRSIEETEETEEEKEIREGRERSFEANLDEELEREAAEKKSEEEKVAVKKAGGGEGKDPMELS